MCDYSLESVTSRPATVTDRLVTSRFPGTVTRGLSELKDPFVAVCLKAGTEIAFDQEPKYERPGVFWPHKVTATSKMARFRQTDRDIPTVHHDALEFSDGTIVLVTKLVSGQLATVLQLPKEEQETAKAKPIKLETQTS